MSLHKYILALALACALPTLYGQTTLQTANTDSTIITSVDEVTLDLVVHGKKNKAVLDLKPEDITVLDNGTAVKLSQLRLVTGSSPADHLVTLVFDHLDSAAGKNAHDIAAKIIKMIPASGFSFSVLEVQSRLRLLQGFTNDRVAVERAVRLASEQDRPGHENEAAQPEKDLISIAQTGTDLSGAVVPGKDHEVSRALLTAMEESQRITQEEITQPSLCGLLALARTQGKVPGRKVIIFFAQGMHADLNAHDMVRSISGAANRAGVSIYTIDANGINEDAGQGLMATMAIGGMRTANQLNPAPSGPGTASAPPGSITAGNDSIDRIESEGLSGYHDPLARLAASTGGAYIVATDNLKKPLRQLIEDMTVYYEASYIPEIQSFDGSFRPVVVKPVRADLNIRSRGGYFALPATGGSSIRPFEAPLLKILEETQLPSDLKFHSGILRFGDLPAGNETTVVVEVPLSELDVHQDPNTNLFSVHPSIVAQIKNKSGSVVEHFSEDIPRHGALESVDTAKSGVVTLQRHFLASPGHYTLETAVMDRSTGKSGAQRIDFEIPNPPAGPMLSDLALVRRTDPFRGEIDSSEPLRYDKLKVVPNLLGEVSHDAKSISVFFLVHTDAQASEQARLEMEVLKDGEPVGHMPLQLRQTSGDAPIPYLASIGASSLTPGTYEVKAALTQGGKTAESMASFRVTGSEIASVALPAKADANEQNSDDARLISDVKSSMATSGNEAQRLIITSLAADAAPPAADEVQTVVEDARNHALHYGNSLPNFICVEVTDRSIDSAGNGRWRHKDSLSELLRYHDNAETRTTIEINGQHSGIERADIKGTLSHGEFGGVLSAVFSVASKANFQWKETDALGSGTVQVLSYRVARENSSFGLTGDNNYQVTTGFHGLVYVDTATHGIRRITLEADDLPHDFSIHTASIAVDYDYIAINNHDYLMPINATVAMHQHKREAVLNEMMFRNYRRYASKVKISYGGEVPAKKPN